MSYLGRKGAVAPLTSADIPVGIVEGTDIAFLENASGQDLSGTYSTERMYLAGRTGSAPNDYNYKLVGNIDVTGHLALGSIADSDVIITQDSTERTITGSGTLDGGNVLQDKDTQRTSLSGMAGWAGMIAPFAMASAPSGWLVCDGSPVSRTTYADLFTAIGTTWGTGDGSSTFNVPDLRGTFLRGTGLHGSEKMADGNYFSGVGVGSFEHDQLQKHQHYLNKGESTTQVGFPPASGSGYAGVAIDQNDFSGERYMARVFQAYDYGTPRTGDETMPFNAGIQYCIKY